MKTLRMTDRWLGTVSTKNGRDEYADAIARGLRLRVSPRSKKWSVLTRVGGKQTRVPLGEYPTVALTVARERANEILTTDSLVNFEKTIHRFAGSGSPALTELCSDYVEQMRAKDQKSHIEYRRALIESPLSFCNFMQRKLGRESTVAEVQSSHVADWLREIYTRAPSHSRHCRAYLHAAFGWAIKAEFDYASPAGRRVYGVKVNPVSATPGGVKSKPRQRVLSVEELRTVWHRISDVAEMRTATAIRMVIAMGGMRVSEILNSELGWYKDGWLLLPETKNGREHALPLTEFASQQFTNAKFNLPKGAPYLFPHTLRRDAPMPITSTGRAVARLIKAGHVDPFQLRDVRRTMKTQLLDREFVEEREIDIWHNHGQKSDIARKHYSWAEYRKLKLRVASQIDHFLSTVLANSAGESALPFGCARQEK